MDNVRIPDRHHVLCQVPFVLDMEHDNIITKYIYNKKKLVTELNVVDHEFE